MQYGRILFFTLIIHTVYFTGCAQTRMLPSQQTGQGNISDDALRYFNDAFSQVQKNSYKKKEIDFDRLYKESLDKMKNAQTYKDTYDAIRYLLAGLQDNHSFFTEPPKNGESIISRLSNQPGTIPFTTSIIDEQYGLLALQSYNSAYITDQHRIADSLYAALKRMQEQHIRGLIIDFRKMEGGSTLPFLCGFAPLINQDMLLGYKDNKGHRTQVVRYKNGIYHKDKNKTTRLCYLTTYTPFSLSQLPIAIITGKYTASAGEMILISFLGLANVKTFGEPTLGVPTGKTNIFLADSAFISLASTTTYGRNRREYASSVIPDVSIDLNNTPEEKLMRMVTDWIKNNADGNP